VTARASMRLYDDYLTNGCAPPLFPFLRPYYTTKLFIGTPPQEFALIVDSGSTVTYVPCSTCEQCGNHHQVTYCSSSVYWLDVVNLSRCPFVCYNVRFQPDLSSTYEPVKCNDDCTCDKEQKQCVYESQYSEMSSSSGVLGEDLISFGKESELKPQRAVFGCANSETGNLFNQHADGIIGLGRGELSIMDQLVDKGVITDSFSLCYGGMDVDGGAMVLGEITPPLDMLFSQSDPIRRYSISLFIGVIKLCFSACAFDIFLRFTCPGMATAHTTILIWRKYMWMVNCCILIQDYSIARMAQSWIVEPHTHICQKKHLWHLGML
ncbi:hypothetical protein BHE74_00023820, partial [Ensete ventricosum]